MAKYITGRYFNEIVEPLSNTECPQQLLIYFGAYVEDSLSILKSIKENLYKIINIQVIVPSKPKISYKKATFKELIEGLKLSYQQLNRIESIIKGHVGGYQNSSLARLQKYEDNFAQNLSKNLYGIDSNIPRYEYVQDQEELQEKQLFDKNEEEIEEENQKLKARIEYLQRYLPNFKDKDESGYYESINQVHHEDLDQEELLTVIKLIRQEYQKQKTIKASSRRPSQNIENM